LLKFGVEVYLHIVEEVYRVFFFDFGGIVSEASEGIILRD
jgi:hypothetical protein